MDDLLENSDVMSLVELQKFLADELAPTGMGKRLEKSFAPLSGGLGLGAPQKKHEQEGGYRTFKDWRTEAPQEPSAILGPPENQLDDAVDKAFMESMRRPRSHTEAPEHFRPTTHPLTQIAAPNPPSKPTLRETLENVTTEAMSPTAPPPPVPQPSWFRRLLATLLDQAFILSVFFLTLLITASVLSKEPGTLFERLSGELSRPQFIRFAVLEYATLWLGYLAIGIGLLDSTFGMWVWGLRISYGTDARPQGLRKWLRVLFCFLLEAPLVTSVVLALRLRGKNLIDWISKSHLYLSPA